MVGVSAVSLGLHFLLPDRGIAACKRTAAYMNNIDNGLPGPTDSGTRADFAGSRYADLRAAGTAMIDYLNSTHGVDPGNGSGVGTLQADFTTLQDACTNHGVKLPPGGAFGNT